MSSFSTSMAVLALAAIGVAGWQANLPDEPSHPVDIPTDPILAAGLPGISALPARIVSEPPVVPVSLPSDHIGDVACGLTVLAEAHPPATIQLTIQDACAPNSVLRLRHAGIDLSLRMDAVGQTELAVPALTNPARVDVVTAEGKNRSVFVDIPDFADYHRAAFAWDGTNGVEIHAEGPGRPIHPGNPGRISAVLLGEGGHLATLGDPALGAMVQIYTHPRDGQLETGVVRLSLVMGAHAATCGQQITGQRIETIDGGPASQARLNLAFPACNASSGDLVLQNMFHDLRIAQR